MGTPIRPCSDVDIAGQHAHIRELCAVIQKAEDLEAFGVRLVELEARLVEHFEVEESPEGRHEVLGSRALNHAGRMDDLIKQHPVILASLHALQTELSSALARTESIVEMIRLHEQAESELVADVLYDDIGGE